MAAAHFSSVGFLVFMVLFPLCSGGRASISKQNLEVDNHLKQLNKPPLKSIKVPSVCVCVCVFLYMYIHIYFVNYTCTDVEFEL